MRLLIESDHPYERLSDYVTFLDAGIDVVVCGGPAPDQTCPALDGQPCPLVDDADAVLNDVDDEATRLAIAEGVRATSPDVPMVVVMPPGIEVELPPGCVRYADGATSSSSVMAFRPVHTGRTRSSETGSVGWSRDVRREVERPNTATLTGRPATVMPLTTMPDHRQ